VEKMNDLAMILEKFPEHLREALLFEEKEDSVIIKAKRYLRSDLFAKVATIVKDLDGEWVMAGANSHFKIPKTKSIPIRI